jgi:hypothetical protein
MRPQTPCYVGHAIHIVPGGREGVCRRFDDLHRVDTQVRIVETTVNVTQCGRAMKQQKLRDPIYLCLRGNQRLLSGFVAVLWPLLLPFGVCLHPFWMPT